MSYVFFLRHLSVPTVRYNAPKHVSGCICTCSGYVEICMDPQTSSCWKNKSFTHLNSSDQTPIIDLGYYLPIQLPRPLTRLKQLPLSRPNQKRKSWGCDFALWDRKKPRGQNSWRSQKLVATKSTMDMTKGTME